MVFPKISEKPSLRSAWCFGRLHRTNSAGLARLGLQRPSRAFLTRQAFYVCLWTVSVECFVLSLPRFSEQQKLVAH